MLTHIITRKWTGGGSTITKSETVQGSGEVNIDQTVDGDETDLLVSYSVLAAELKSIYMVAGTDQTVTPRNGVTPLDPIDLSAGVPFVWTEGSGLDNPFSDDITSLHVANGSSSAGLLQVRSLVDASPETAS